LSSGLGKLQFYLEIKNSVEGMKICEGLSWGLGKLQFYLKIKNSVEGMKICEGLIWGTRKAAVLFGNWEFGGRHENMRRIELRTRKAAVLFGN
jgi:hypothetical protein